MPCGPVTDRYGGIESGIAPGQRIPTGKCAVWRSTFLPRSIAGRGRGGKAIGKDKEPAVLVEAAMAQPTPEAIRAAADRGIDPRCGRRWIRATRPPGISPRTRTPTLERSCSPTMPMSATGRADRNRCRLLRGFSDGCDLNYGGAADRNDVERPNPISLLTLAQVNGTQHRRCATIGKSWAAAVRTYRWKLPAGHADPAGRIGQGVARRHRGVAEAIRRSRRAGADQRLDSGRSDAAARVPGNGRAFEFRHRPAAWHANEPRRGRADANLSAGPQVRAACHESGRPALAEPG